MGDENSTSNNSGSSGTTQNSGSKIGYRWKEKSTSTGKTTDYNWRSDSGGLWNSGSIRNEESTGGSTGNRGQILDGLDVTDETIVEKKFVEKTFEYGEINISNEKGEAFSASGKIGDISSEGSVSVGIIKDGKFDPAVKGNVDINGTVASGEVSFSDNYTKTTLNVNVGEVNATGSVNASIFEDGRLNPAIEAEISGSVVAASGTVESQLGSDKNNIYGEASGEVLGANAHANMNVGRGKAEVSAGAEAYLAKGSVAAGITILGIKIGTEVEGKVGGAGVNVGAGIRNGSADVSLGAGLGVGAGIKIKVDWSGFKFPWEKDDKNNTSSYGGPANFMVYPEKLKLNADTLDNTSKELVNNNYQLDEILNSSSFKEESFRYLKPALRSIRDSVNKQSKNMDILKKYLEQISVEYENTEKSLL